MTPIEASYIAGLMDGEGCFYVAKTKNPRTPVGFQYKLLVEITMCDIEPIEYMANITQTKIEHKTLKSGRKAYKLIYRCAHAANLINELFPYLKGKKEQAKLCIYYHENLAVGRGKSHTFESIALCEDIRVKIKDLKYINVLRC